MSYYSLDLRIRAVSSYLEGEGSLLEISELYKISTSSLKRWLKFHKEGRTLDSISEGKGRKPKVDDAGEYFIAELIKQNSSITLKELSEAYAKKKGVKAGRSVLSRVVQKLNLRYKKLSVYASEQDTQAVKKKT